MEHSESKSEESHGRNLQTDDNVSEEYTLHIKQNSEVVRKVSIVENHSSVSTKEGVELVSPDDISDVITETLSRLSEPLSIGMTNVVFEQHDNTDSPETETEKKLILIESGLGRILLSVKLY